jgi:hypothetical protein
VTDVSVAETEQPSDGEEEESSPQAVKRAAVPRAARIISFFIFHSPLNGFFCVIIDTPKYNSFLRKKHKKVNLLSQKDVKMYLQNKQIKK